MKTFLTLAMLCLVSAIDTNTHKYMHYLSKQNKNYKTVEEFEQRLQNFIATDKFIEEWNANEEKTHTVGHNFLSDWSQAERDVISAAKARSNARIP
jgi:hypothetical protein